MIDESTPDRPQHVCLQCNYTWIGRRRHNATADGYARPAMCPSCHTKWWDTAPDDMRERQHHECLRCGRVWESRRTTPYPKRCPSCNSPYWDKPRTRNPELLARIAETRRQSR